MQARPSAGALILDSSASRSVSEINLCVLFVCFFVFPFFFFLNRLPIFRRLIIAVENELRRKLTMTGTKGAWKEVPNWVAN